jgi:hypothetical protein
MTTAGSHTTHSQQDTQIRSRSMLLLHEDLARARIVQRLDEAEAMRQARIARARRARKTQSRVARATSRARLIVAFGSTR